MADEQQQQQNLDVDGYEAITAGIMDLLNQFPGIQSPVTFSTLGNSGVGMFPQSGALIERERRSITGKVVQECAYSFYLVSRVSGLSGEQRAAEKELLDTFGRWLEGQTVTVNGESVTLTEYPKLTGNRQITRIKRTSPAFMSVEDADHAENWVISINAQYKNTYQRS